MADGYSLAAMAGLRAALIADPAMIALVGDRVVDDPGDGILFPYVRFSEVDPRPDDTDGALGAIVSVGFEIHSRAASGGRTEAMRICEAINAALHRSPQAVTADPFTVSEIQVQLWTVDRAADGATWEGRLALEIHLDA